MGFQDRIYANKEFIFFKQLMRNIALAICIMLVGVLVLVYGFKYKLYDVLSYSQEPYFTKGDMVVVKEQSEYKVGDIIKFDHNGIPTAHRLIAIVKDSKGATRYICHGDNNGDLDGTASDQDYKDDVAEISKHKNATSEFLEKEYGNNIQTPTLDKIEGKVVTHIDNYGNYFNFIKTHYMLLISLILGIWCISSVVQNEIDIKKCRRLF